MSGVLRHITLTLPLILAFGVPYVLFSDSVAPLRQSLTSTFTSDTDGSGGADANVNFSDGLSDFPPLAESAAQTEQVPQPLDLPSALRFEITPRWVLNRWPRVTTTRSEQPFDGLRVPLITGTGPFDLAGSLTYYFDQNSQLQRISFRGYTSDERYVVSVVTRQFGMHPKPSVNASIYLNSWNGKPTSALIIRRRPVVQSLADHRNFEVQLEINRPNDYFGLSSHFEQLLATSTASKPTAGQLR
jgi:hypothetical protein